MLIFTVLLGRDNINLYLSHVRSGLDTASSGKIYQVPGSLNSSRQRTGGPSVRSY